MLRVILVGGDKTVYFLARHLAELHHRPTIINRHAKKCQELVQQTSATVILGDGTNLETLEEAGARKADVLMALTPHDEDNLVCCQLAKRVYQVPRTVAMVNDPEHEEVFQKLGVDVTLSKTRVLATLIEHQSTFDNITNLMPLANGQLNISEVVLDGEAPSVGKTLTQLSLSKDTLIACIIRDGKVIVPNGQSRLEADDHLLILSQPSTIDRDMLALTGERV